jgi:hypothetical protein
MYKIIIVLAVIATITACVDPVKQKQNLAFTEKVEKVKITEKESDIQNCELVKNVEFDTSSELDLRDHMDALEFAKETTAKLNANVFYLEHMQLTATGIARDSYFIRGAAYNCK